MTLNHVRGFILVFISFSLQIRHTHTLCYDSPSLFFSVLLASRAATPTHTTQFPKPRELERTRAISIGSDSGHSAASDCSVYFHRASIVAESQHVEVTYKDGEKIAQISNLRDV
eukprot:m.295918 g.295918  ORF g.295918 m.295918 type:complete len:114 (+) comp22973_c7_seq4:2386-2727(+)